MTLKLYLVLFILSIPVFKLAAQPEIEAILTESQIIFDGMVNEQAWEKASTISNFTQRELNYGEPISERTEVAVVFDNNNLYIGVWCYQNDASKIVAKYMKPDFDYESDDNFQIMISYPKN